MSQVLWICVPCQCHGSGRPVDLAVGKELVATFERPSGYGSAYCRTCGSPAPDQSYDKTTYAIPVGMLNEIHELKVQEHIFVGSKASWDIIGDSAPQRHELESSSPAGP